MPATWDRGVLDSSSWHKLETIGEFTDAASMISHGELSGAWPVGLEFGDLSCLGLVSADERGVVASYREHPSRIVGVVGNNYHFTPPDSWRALVEAACMAGAVPTGCFSLRKGRIIIGTFQINGAESGIVTNLLLSDAFDGSGRLSCGLTSIRVVCANTLSLAFKMDGAGMAKFRHTASLTQKIDILKEAIEGGLDSGQKIRDLYNRAVEMNMAADQAKRVFDALFPQAEDGGTDRKRTRRENVRMEAMEAALLDINRVGELGVGNLASLWNAATYLVDRELDGSPRLRGEADPLESMLLGSRGKRVSEILSVVESVIEND